jgi:hypothetical protein
MVKDGAGSYSQTELIEQLACPPGIPIACILDRQLD